MGLRGRLRRFGKLEREAGAALQEAWTHEAVRRLGDYDLALLDGVLERGFDPQKERQDIPVAPAERAAYLRFLDFYEEAQRGA